MPKPSPTAAGRSRTAAFDGAGTFAVSASWRLGAPQLSRRAMPPGVVGWLLTAFEALSYVWFKQLSALRGISWAVRRVRRWETSRESETPYRSTS